MVLERFKTNISKKISAKTCMIFTIYFWYSVTEWCRKTRKVVQKYLVIELFITIIDGIAYMISNLNANHNANYITKIHI